MWRDYLQACIKRYWKWTDPIPTNNGSMRLSRGNNCIYASKPSSTHIEGRTLVTSPRVEEDGCLKDSLPIQMQWTPQLDKQEEELQEVKTSISTLPHIHLKEGSWPKEEEEEDAQGGTSAKLSVTLVTKGTSELQLFPTYVESRERTRSHR